MEFAANMWIHGFPIPQVPTNLHPTPGVSIRQRPRLVPGGCRPCRPGCEENSIGCRSFTQLLAG